MQSHMALVLMFAMLAVVAANEGDAPSDMLVPVDEVPEDDLSAPSTDEAPVEGTTPASPPSTDEAPVEGTTPVSPPSTEAPVEGTTPASPPSTDEAPVEGTTPVNPPSTDEAPVESPPSTDEAPVESPPSTDEAPVEGTNPASPLSPDIIDQVWCQPQSDDCASFGDDNSTCVADGTGLGLCECGDGFENPSSGQKVAYVCLPEGETQIEVRSTIAWKDAACSSFTTEFASDLKAMLENIFNGNITSLLDKCGSLTVFSTAENVEALDVVGLDLRTAIAKEIASGNYASVAALGVPDSATVSTSSGSCPLEHAIATATDTTGTCNALKCEAGYHVEKAATPVTAPYRCVRDASREIDDDDDDLSSGAIAGITIGVLLFVGLVVGVLLMCLCGKEEAPAYNPEHEPAAEPAV